MQFLALVMVRRALYLVCWCRGLGGVHDLLVHLVLFVFLFTCTFCVATMSWVS